MGLLLRELAVVMGAKMRGYLSVATVVCALSTGGCGYFFPGFEGPFGIYSFTHDIPVGHITTAIQCELYDFMAGPNGDRLLSEDGTAEIAIKFSVDDSGKFEYIGIDLDKMGFSSLAALVSYNNNMPSLRASLKGASSSFSKLELKIPQSLERYYLINEHAETKQNKGSHRGAIKIPHKDIIKAKFEQDYCSNERKLLAPLSLKTWLDKFYGKLKSEIQETKLEFRGVEFSTITLQTQFLLAVDLSAGVSPFIAPAFILPVSGENFYLNPSASHSLEIKLKLKSRAEASITQ